MTGIHEIEKGWVGGHEKDKLMFTRTTQEGVSTPSGLFFLFEPGLFLTLLSFCFWEGFLQLGKIFTNFFNSGSKNAMPPNVLVFSWHAHKLSSGTVCGWRYLPIWSIVPVTKLTVHEMDGSLGKLQL